jgi:hypothetical protein
VHVYKILHPKEEWNIEKKIKIPQGGMLKFTYKGVFLTIKIVDEKFLD